MTTAAAASAAASSPPASGGTMLEARQCRDKQCYDDPLLAARVLNHHNLPNETDVEFASHGG